MQRLLAFIEHNLYLILFVVLQAVCAFLLFSLNPYQQAAFTNGATEVTARVNEVSTNVIDYLDLKKQNTLLQDQLSNQFKESSTGYLTYLNDTFIVKDSSKHYLYSMIPAQVVYNTVHKAENIFIINIGTKQGVKKNMGVVSSEGMAGIVLKSNTNYSTVMSLLNTNMKVIPAINGQEYFTELVWNNETPYKMSIYGINKLEEIKVGDKIMTGNSSLLFPSGIPIGEISKLSSKTNNQYFDTELTTATNFRALEYVYVIINHQKSELESMMTENE
jgi:rod shape-determining protein MreC